MCKSFRDGAAQESNLPSDGLRRLTGFEDRLGHRARAAPRSAYPALRYPRAVARYFLVARARGPAWDHDRRRREQQGWDEHAAFMDALVKEGFVVLGGPVGEGDGEEALLVVDADTEARVRARLADDPWGEDMLVTESVRPWSVWLGAPPR